MTRPYWHYQHTHRDTPSEQLSDILNTVDRTANIEQSIPHVGAVGASIPPTRLSNQAIAQSRFQKNTPAVKIHLPASLHHPTSSSLLRCTEKEHTLSLTLTVVRIANTRPTHAPLQLHAPLPQHLFPFRRSSSSVRQHKVRQVLHAPILLFRGFGGGGAIHALELPPHCLHHGPIRDGDTEQSLVDLGGGQGVRGQEGTVCGDGAEDAVEAEVDFTVSWGEAEGGEDLGDGGVVGVVRGA